MADAGLLPAPPITKMRYCGNHDVWYTRYAFVMSTAITPEESTITLELSQDNSLKGRFWQFVLDGMEPIVGAYHGPTDKRFLFDIFYETLNSKLTRRTPTNKRIKK